MCGGGLPGLRGTRTLSCGFDIKPEGALAQGSSFSSVSLLLATGTTFMDSSCFLYRGDPGVAPTHLTEANSESTP